MNIKYPQLSFVYNRRKTASSTRKATVELRVSYDYRQKYISTGIMLFPNQWHKGCIVNTPDMLQISKVLDKLLTDVREILVQMLESNGVIYNTGGQVSTVGPWHAKFRVIRALNK